MGIIDHIYLMVLYYFDKYDLSPTYGFIIAFVVSTLQMKKRGTFKLAESLLCGVFVAKAVLNSFTSLLAGIVLIWFQVLTLELSYAHS